MFAVWAACNPDRMEPDGISDIEGKVARVATSKLGNERVSISGRRTALVFIGVWLSQGVRPVADMIEIGYHSVVTAEIWGSSRRGDLV
jgi:hypothetical protein